MTERDSMGRFAASLHEREAKLNPDQVNMAAANKKGANRLNNVAPRSQVMDEQFPTADLQAEDPRDAVMDARLQLQDPTQPGMTRFGKLIARDEDFEWLAKKQAATEEANFQAWFAANFDLMNPADKARAKELFPAFYAQRKKLLKTQAKNLVRLATLKLEGVQDMKDLQTQYLAETGRLDIGPIKNMLNPELVNGGLNSNELSQWQQRKFKRGLLSPFLVFGKEVVPKPGYSITDTRKQEALNYEMRFRPASSFEQGFGQNGFPGFPSAMGSNTANPTDPGTAAWFTLLSQQN